jgi:hypothetical protein
MGFAYPNQFLAKDIYITIFAMLCRGPGSSYQANRHDKSSFKEITAQ